ncbi:hypothetical protein EDC04DRAFT_2610709 [Pisolithus marmoratus]|nr:hypothetical protein EDC04DRAFT_2610709 [Pisolithus marmoratus]
MSHAYFPEDVPSEDILNKLLATESVQGSAVTREFRHSNDLNINQCKVQDLVQTGRHTTINRVFYDPIVAEDTDFGYTFKEHLPVEDPDQEEGRNQEGWEQDDAMSQAV